MTTLRRVGDLDPGIRETVVWLRKHGFDTTDSGDGVSKLARDPEMHKYVLDIPHVFMRVARSAVLDEADRLAALVASIPTAKVEASYAPGGESILALLGVDDTQLADARGGGR